VGGAGGEGERGAGAAVVVVVGSEGGIADGIVLGCVYAVKDGSVGAVDTCCRFGLVL